MIKHLQLRGMLKKAQIPLHRERTRLMTQVNLTMFILKNTNTVTSMFYICVGGSSGQKRGKRKEHEGKGRRNEELMQLVTAKLSKLDDEMMVKKQQK